MWLPYASESFDRHRLRLAADAFLGPGGSYPVVVATDLVVKFFGFAGEWHATWENERRAYQRLAQDDRIRAPKLIAHGVLFPGEPEPLPYLILTRMQGQSWCEVTLELDQRITIASELGQQLRLIHTLPHDGLPSIAHWQTGTAGDGARSGAFPSELVNKVDAWVDAVPVAPPCFVHSDIFERHPLVANGHLTGIIDWGDAMAADPHVELAKLHLDVFAGDRRLLRAFIDGYEWPVDADFARRALAMALRRHAQIHGQHGPGGDVFYRLPELLAGTRIRDLDSLAEQLFSP